MTIAVTVRRLGSVGVLPLVEVDITPSLLSRLLAVATGGLFGRRSSSRLTHPLYSNGNLWVYNDTLRVVEDDVHAAIVAALADAQLQRRLRTAIAASRRDYFDALYDERLN